MRLKRDYTLRKYHLWLIPAALFLYGSLVNGVGLVMAWALRADWMTYGYLASGIALWYTGALICMKFYAKGIDKWRVR